MKYLKCGCFILVYVLVLYCLAFRYCNKQQVIINPSLASNPWYMVDTKSPAFDAACSGLTCEVYLSSAIVEPDKYTQLIRLIETAPAKSTINLHLSGTGGYIDPAINLYNAIALSKAEINTTIDGPVYSAHAYIAMLGKHVTIAPGVLFMFHLPAVLSPITKENELPSEICKLSIGAHDRGQDSYKKCMDGNAAWSIVSDKLLKERVYPYLTKPEVSRMKQGYDIYINGDEMKQRLLKHK